VIAAAEGKQRPEISVSMYDQYSLAPAAGTGGSAAVTAPPAPGQASEVAQAWVLVEHTTSVAVLDDFIRQFGMTPIYGVSRGAADYAFG
jgi:hypothetical protein